jgi:hypothetical protein
MGLMCSHKSLWYWKFSCSFCNINEQFNQYQPLNFRFRDILSRILCNNLVIHRNLEVLSCPSSFLDSLCLLLLVIKCLVLDVNVITHYHLQIRVSPHCHLGWELF